MKYNIGSIIAMLFLAVFVTSCSREAPPLVAPEPKPEVNYITMNEVYSRGTAVDPDWIEIFNASTEQKDISGYKIYDSGAKGGTKAKKSFPANTVIPANGFFVIVTDDTSASGFGLSSSGEEVWLEDATGKLVDQVVFPALEETQSYGKEIDGGKTWKVLDKVTRGTSNTGGAVAILPVVMNEIYSRGVPETPDWIEIYNPSTVAVDITGYKIYDSGGKGGTKPKKEFPAGSIVPARGYLVIVTDDTDPSGFGLSSGGEEVWLEDTTGAVVDNVIFPPFEVTQSYCRIPNGGPTWVISATITRGAENKP